MFFAAQFAIPKQWKQFKFPSKDKCGPFHTVESYPEDKRKIADLSLSMLLDLKELSEEANFRTSHTQKVPFM